MQVVLFIVGHFHRSLIFLREMGWDDFFEGLHTKSWFQALTTNNRLGWKCLTVTNSPAY
jgi:hypothetical protein